MEEQEKKEITVMAATVFHAAKLVSWLNTPAELRNVSSSLDEAEALVAEATKRGLL